MAHRGPRPLGAIKFNDVHWVCASATRSQRFLAAAAPRHVRLRAGAQTLWSARDDFDVRFEIPEVASSIPSSSAAGVGSNGPLTGAGGPLGAASVGDTGVAAGVGALNATVVDGIGVTRETNIQPVGAPDTPSGGSILVGQSDGMGAIPKPLFDWVFLKQDAVLSTATAGVVYYPYYEWASIDYVGHVLHGKTFSNLELEVMITVSPTTYHMGLLTFAWLPEYPSRADGLNPARGDWGYLRSRKHTVTVNLAAPEVVVIRCPLVRPAGGLSAITKFSPQFTQRDALVMCARGLGRVDGAYTDVTVVMQARLVPGSTTMGLTASQFVSAASERPWSGALGALSTAAGHLSKVPVLSGVMMPAERFLEAGATFAKSMGLSAPVETDVPKPQTLMTSGPLNADIGTNGVILSGLSTTQRAVAAPFTDGEPDECATATIAARPGHVATFVLSASRASGAGLVEADTTSFGVVVDPLWRAGSSSDYTAGISGVAWLALAHGFWRGSLKYKCSVIASKYHSMRIRVIYDSDPMATPDAIPNREAAAYTYSEVFDISEKSVIEFTIPWCAPRAWNPCLRAITKWPPSGPAGTYSGSGGGTFTNSRVHHNGVVYFMVESALVGAFPGVPDGFLMVEVSGGDDFAVAFQDLGKYLDCGKTIAVSSVVGADARVSARPLGRGIEFREPFKLYGMDGVVNVRTLCKEMVCVGPVAPTAPASGGGSAVTPTTRAWMGPVWGRFRPAGRQRPAAQNYWCRGYGVVSGGSVYRVSIPLVVGVTGGTTATPTWLNSNSGPVTPLMAGACYDYNELFWDVATQTGFKGVPEAWFETTAAVQGFIASLKNKLHGLAFQYLGLSAFEVTVPMVGCGAGLPGWYAGQGGNVDLGQIEVPATLFYIGSLPATTGASTTDLETVEPFLYVAGSDDYNLSYFDGPPRFTIKSFYEGTVA